MACNLDFSPNNTILRQFVFLVLTLLAMNDIRYHQIRLRYVGKANNEKLK